MWSLAWAEVGGPHHSLRKDKSDVVSGLDSRNRGSSHTTVKEVGNFTLFADLGFVSMKIS
jgi:hypothetical protein